VLSDRGLFISLPLVAAPAPCREHNAPQTLVGFTESSDLNTEKHNINGEVHVLTLFIGAYLKTMLLNQAISVKC
jgi:hypothetical protein